MSRGGRPYTQQIIPGNSYFLVSTNTFSKSTSRAFQPCLRLASRHITNENGTR